MLNKDLMTCSEDRSISTNRQIAKSVRYCATSSFQTRMRLDDVIDSVARWLTLLETLSLRLKTISTLPDTILAASHIQQRIA